MIDKIRTLFEKHGRHIATGALAAGFIFDFFTLQRIDRVYENVVLISHLLIVSCSIILFQYADLRKTQRRLFQNIVLFAPVIMQFSLGALFSGISILYLRSATISVNILFVGILFALLIGNEFLREKYTRLVFQVTLLYFVLFSYMALVTPLLTQSIGAGTFLLSSVLSLVLMSLFVYALSRIITERFRQTKRTLMGIVGGLFIVMNVLYFANIIPPIPLSLQHINPYYSVSRQGDVYRVEVAEKWSLFDTMRVVEGQGVAVFSSVFSPTRIDITIYHHWQYFDRGTNKWISAGRIGYDIVGGRDGGFRGYTIKRTIFPGTWRVDVETERGQLIGRETFRIVYVDDRVATRFETR